MNSIKITNNGSHLLDSGISGSSSGQLSIYVSGDLGAASAQLEYVDYDGNFIPLTDGTIDVNEQYLVNVGIGVQTYMTVTGADGATSINVTSASR